MFSLRMLLAVVTVSAVYIAGMVYRTEWWRASILTLTVAIYAAAISAAILAKQHRAFFIVFAVFGLAYLFCVYLGIDTVPGRIVQQWALKLPVEAVQAPASAYAPATGTPPAFAPMPGAPPAYAPPPAYVSPGPVYAPGFMRPGFAELRSIGNSFFALLISLVAGVIAEAVVRRRGKSE
jgi:hypothetical protein